MDTFEELKSQWDDQTLPKVPENGAQTILKRIGKIQKKQKIANGVLLITAGVLISFFIYISAHRSQVAMTGLFLMIGSVVFRIVLEMLSIRYLHRLDVSQVTARFKQSFRDYYRKRKVVHFIITPVTILLYCSGFIYLLPSFKASLSSGFYTYIVSSSIVLLLVLGGFIAKQIQKELTVLRSLRA